MTWYYLISLACFFIGANASSYLISSPSTLYRGSEYAVTVDILNTTGVEVEATLQYRYYNSSPSRYVVQPVMNNKGIFGRGATGTLSLPIPTNFYCPSCRLNLRGRGGLQFEREMYVPVSSSSVALLVQTNKAIYKPGQTVRFRALAIYPDLQLVHGKINVEVRDPKGNKVKVMRGLSSTSGVVEGSLELSDQPIFGYWRLAVEMDGTNARKTESFEVAQYQLPRFEVSVELPPYGLTRDTDLTGKVKVKYVFGQPVKGMVELHFGPNRGPDYCGKPPKTTQMAFEIDGEAPFSMPTSDIQRAVRIYDGTDVKVTAFVKEAATGIQLNSSSIITYHSNKFNIEFLENTPSVFKPGLPFKAFVRVSTPDDLPPTTGSPGYVSVFTHVTYRLTVDQQHMYNKGYFSGTYPLPGQNLSLSVNGVLPVNVHIPSNASSITMKATYDGRTVTKTISKTTSKSDTYIQLTALDKNIQSKSNATFNLRATEPMDAFTYMVMSRGVVVSYGLVHANFQKSVDFELPVTPAMAPTGHLLAYYSRGSDEVVADSLAFSVEGIFENEVSISFSVHKSEPNRNVSVTLTADANSTVNVLAVDQSVLLLRAGNDITAKKVENAVSMFDVGDVPDSPMYALSYSASSAGEVFRKAGLSFVSDVDMREYRSLPQVSWDDDGCGGSNWGGAGGRPMPTMAPGQTFYPSTPAAPMAPGGSGGLAPSGGLQEVTRVRMLFPEAWLWSSAVTGADGKANISTTVPDTITSWVASAFATNPLSGLGVAPSTATLQVFRPFFVSLTYPSIVTRNEQLVIQATVFNYLTSDLDVVVTLKASSSFKNVKVMSDGTETMTQGDVISMVHVVSQEQGVVYFPVLASDIGVADVEVSAQSSNAADAVRRHINIQAEGAPASFNYPVFINNKAASPPFSDVIDFPLPPSTVSGSATARVKVTGDLIGSSLDNLESLLALPTGCGEQSMVKFAPDLYIYQYLQATSQLTQYLDTKIVRYLEYGYQRQLTYQRRDGGFSAFGNRDESGSTWLTSLVARTFSEAKSTIYVDDQVLRRAVDWLLDRQNLNGSFSEFGRVLDRNIQGNEGGPALTASVLLALLENRDTADEQLCHDKNYCSRFYKWRNATVKAMTNLEVQLDKMTELFPLALTTYALSVSGSRRAGDALNKLNARAHIEGGLTYWAANKTVTPPNSPTPRLFQHGSAYLSSWSPPRVQARPIDILTTSYAVLAHLTQGFLDAGLPAVRWLTTQRNSLGGFASTQDTIVALKALSTYATNSSRQGSVLTVKVTSDSKEALDFDVNDQNALSLQTKMFQTVPSKIDFTSSGVGIALVEVDYNFHVHSELSTPSFDVSTVLLDDELNQFNLMVCTKWLWDRKTGMVVQEIGIPSGFEPDLTSLSDVAGMKRSERRGNAVHVYFDEITKTSLCYSVLMSRNAKVARSERTYVRTYNYYEPADQSTVFYVPRNLRDATICDVCDKCCQ
ncbi:CD109 antigen [Aplysia californica]|uniref:CD109 antigen n=1 Tax=Aplysia californica TaxID=6500 RepID=A0ABM1ADK5_APLCA|nr:CD109 antigen [Aplysia californica]